MQTDEDAAPDVDLPAVTLSVVPGEAVLIAAFKAAEAWAVAITEMSRSQPIEVKARMWERFDKTIGKIELAGDAIGKWFANLGK